METGAGTAQVAAALTTRQQGKADTLGLAKEQNAGSEFFLFTPAHSGNPLPGCVSAPLLKSHRMKKVLSILKCRLCTKQNLCAGLA